MKTYRLFDFEAYRRAWADVRDKRAMQRKRPHPRSKAPLIYWLRGPLHIRQPRGRKGKGDKS